LDAAGILQILKEDMVNTLKTKVLQPLES